MLAMAAPPLRTFLNSRSYEKHFIVRGDVRHLGSRAPSEMLEPHVTDSSKKETKAARQQARRISKTKIRRSLFFDGWASSRRGGPIYPIEKSVPLLAKLLLRHCLE